MASQTHVFQADVEFGAEELTWNTQLRRHLKFIKGIGSVLMLIGCMATLSVYILYLMRYTGGIPLPIDRTIKVDYTYQNQTSCIDLQNYSFGNNEYTLCNDGVILHKYINDSITFHIP